MDSATDERPMDDEHPHTEVRPLRANTPYMLLMSGKTTQMIGTGVALFTVPLIAFQLTGSVLAAGIVAAAGQLGAAAAMLPAGVIADSVDRRAMLIWCSILGLALWTSLVVATLLHALTIWHLGFALMGTSILAAFYGPGETASIRQIIHPSQMGSAMAALEGRSAVTSLISGPLGGILFGAGHAIPMIVSAAGYAIAGICTAKVRLPLNGRAEAGRSHSAVEALAEGLRYVLHIPFFRNTLIVFAVLNVGFSGIIVALNLHLVQIGTKPILIGAIDTAIGASMLAGAALAGPLVQRIATGRIAIVSIVIMTVALCGVAFATHYWHYLVLIAIAAFVVPPLNSGILGYSAAITPGRLQGRLQSVLGLSGAVFTPLAPVLAGWGLSALGVSLTMGGFAALIVACSVPLLAMKQIRAIGTAATWSCDYVDWPNGPTAVTCSTASPASSDAERSTSAAIPQSWSESGSENV